MRPTLVEVSNVLAEKSAQVLFAEDKRVIEALAAKASDETLTVGIHIWMKTANDLDVAPTGNVVEDHATRQVGTSRGANAR